MIIELGMESQSFYFGLLFLATFIFVLWFMVGRKGGYGPPTVLNLRKGENAASQKGRAVVQANDSDTASSGVSPMRDVTPSVESLHLMEGQTPPKPPLPPPQAMFMYNGHAWDAFEVLGVSPYSSFSEITFIYQNMIKKADAGKHEFLQTAYMAILKIK